MIYPLNPTLSVVEKIAGVLEEVASQCMKVQPDLTRLERLLGDSEIKEWRTGIRTVKAGGNGRPPRHRKLAHR